MGGIFKGHSLVECVPANGYNDHRTNYLKVTLMNDSQFRLTRSAFAKTIGKTIGSVKQAMRRGNYKDQYVVRNGKYFFRPQEALRENQDHNPDTPVTTKRKINRGNHEKAKYPNEAFRAHNELKKLISLQKKVSPEVAEEYVSGFDQWKEEHLARRLRFK